jgi:tRNA U38,U39,U40 pseudouridine synthase TruA
MQRNPGVNTIEEELLNALLKAKLISQQNFDEPQSMAFQVRKRICQHACQCRNVVHDE